MWPWSRQIIYKTIVILQNQAGTTGEHTLCWKGALEATPTQKEGHWQPVQLWRLQGTTPTWQACWDSCMAVEAHNTERMHCPAHLVRTLWPEWPIGPKGITLLSGQKKKLLLNSRIYTHGQILFSVLTRDASGSEHRWTRTLIRVWGVDIKSRLSA